MVLAGPSGSGKSRLASRLNAAHGWPIFRLDDFYREEDDPAMPRSETRDHRLGPPRQRDAERAVASLCDLVDTGRPPPRSTTFEEPRQGHHEVAAGPADLILAEGIFAAEVVDRLRECGVLHSAWCIHHRPEVTFVRRLPRDLKERRKPPLVLVRRGLSLMRDEPGIVRRQTDLGASPPDRGRRARPRTAAERVG